MKPSPRRHFLISSLQVRLLLLNTAYMLALALGLGMALFVPLIRRMQDASLSSFDRSEAGAQLLVLYTRLWPGLALFVGLFLVHQVLVTHRMVGPLFRIRATLKKVTEGVLIERMKLREHDLLLEDEVVVNQMLESLRERVQRSRDDLGELRAAVTALESGAAPGTAPSGSDWTSLCAALSRLERELKSFDLGPAVTQTPRVADGQASPPQALPRKRSETLHAGAAGGSDSDSSAAA